MAISILPLCYMVIGSFQNITGTMAFPPNLIPNTIENYKVILFGADLVSTIGNTLIFMGITVIGSTFLSLLFGYYNTFPRIVIFSLTFSFYMFSISRFVLISKMGLVDNPIGAALPLLFSPASILLCKNFFAEMPKAYKETADIEGVGEITYFFDILIPISKSLVACIVITTSLFCLSDYMWQFLVLRYKECQTYIIRLFWFVTTIKRAEDYVTPISRRLVVGVLLIIPQIIIFILGSKYFTNNLHNGLKE
jgi:fructooligosaccharide transport system permease protein